MKKGKILIAVKPENLGFKKAVKGLLSKTMGIHKDIDCDKYIVTHLKTGLRTFDFYTMKDARKFIELIDKTVFPFPWDSFSCLKDAEKAGIENGPLMHKLFNAVHLT